MPNTNFQTFHQMGPAINEVVRQATGRDNVQNIDMEHITVAQNHYYQDVDVSGPVVSFHAGAAGLPLEKCVVQIEPVQEGSGDPAPDNVRPIIGWTGANVYVSPTTDAADGQTYSITFPSEAGTVYGGTLDVTTGELVVDRAMVDLGTLDWYYRISSQTFSVDFPSMRRPSTLICSNYVQATDSNIENVPDKSIWNRSYAYSANNLVVKDLSYTDAASFNTAMSGVQLVYELATPITYQLSNPEVIVTLNGVNNIWSDAGDIEVKFKDLKELY